MVFYLFFGKIFWYIAYVDLRKIEYAKEIANVLSESRNHVILNSDGLMLNVKQYDEKSKK